MSLIHKFYLVEINDFNLLNYEIIYSRLIEKNKTENIKIIEEIYLEDELFSYLEDTLFWIPSKTLSDFNLNTSKGLNRYGITILDKTSSVIMYNRINRRLHIFWKSEWKIWRYKNK